jgi:hypothetical protein
LIITFWQAFSECTTTPSMCADIRAAWPHQGLSWLQRKEARGVVVALERTVAAPWVDST